MPGVQWRPLIAHFGVGPFHRRPSRAVGDLFLPCVSGTGGKSMIEGFAIDVLCMRRQMAANSRGKVGVRPVGHDLCFRAKRFPILPANDRVVKGPLLVRPAQHIQAAETAS